MLNNIFMFLKSGILKRINLLFPLLAAAALFSVNLILKVRADVKKSVRINALLITAGFAAVFIIQTNAVKLEQVNGAALIPMLNVFTPNTAAVNNKIINQNKPGDGLNEKVAEAYGVNAFKKVKKIDYTFNVEFNGKKFKRSWEWYPKTNDITYWGKDSTGKEIKFSYNRNKPMNEETKKIDAGFINDNYWLLFPFHLAWDNNVKFTDAGMMNLPIGKGKARCLIVKFSDKVGYTPGDVFKLFLDKNNMIKQWIYEHAGSTKNPRPAVWEGNKSFGGFTVSTLHYGPDKKFKLWFSGIKVEFEK